MKKSSLISLIIIAIMLSIIIWFGMLVSCAAVFTVPTETTGTSSSSGIENQEEEEDTKGSNVVENEKGNEDDQISDPEQNEENSTEFEINDIVTYDDAQYILTEVRYSQGSTFDYPADGMEYVIVFISITNNGERNLSYNPYDWKISNSLGQLTDNDFSTIDGDTSLSSGELLPGGSISGTIVFEQPIDDPELRLHFYGDLWDSSPGFEIAIN